MLRRVCIGLIALAAIPGSGVARPPIDASTWTIYITNDNCPDYTWGLTEEHTKQAFADVVKGHLDDGTSKASSQRTTRTATTWR